VPEWVDWYLKENFNGDCLTFGYAQAGQENSFGWPAMKNGITYQFEQLKKLSDEGKIEVEPLGDTGRWFKDTYACTPASAITAHTAYDDENTNSVWYCTKNYRINLFSSDGKMHIRDLHIFCENAPDPFEDTVCPGNEAAYETLPIIDGNRHSGNGVIAGGYFTFSGGIEPVCKKMEFTDLGNGRAKVDYGSITFTLREDGFTVTGAEPFRLENRIGSRDDHMMEVKSQNESTVNFSYMGTDYGISLEHGHFENAENIVSEYNMIDVTVINK